jgi:hypothetical protein
MISPYGLALVLLATWLVFSAANLHSVATFSRVTVLVFAVSLPVLILVLLRARRDGLAPLPPVAVAAALAGIAAVVEQVRFFTYLPYAWRELSIHLVAGTALVAAGLWLVPRRAARTAAVALAALCLIATTWISVRYDPAPRIDVWHSLDQATRGLLDLRNPYEQRWVGSPGIQDAFTYLPMTAVLLAPFEWLFGDVRWGLLTALLASGWFLTRLSGAGRHEEPPNGSYDPRFAAVLLWLTPGQLAQTEQTWTEPLLLCLVLATLWFVASGRPVGAVIALAVALAAKQHMALLLPTLAAWRPFGWRRTAAAALGAGVLCLPWLLWSPAHFVRDTFILLVEFPPLRLSNNLYISAFRAGWTPPFWLTGLIVLAVLVGTALSVRAEQPPLACLALWWALLTFTVNLVNKQAFYNQFWFVGSLLLLALATAPVARGKPPPGELGAGDQPVTLHRYGVRAEVASEEARGGCA